MCFFPLIRILEKVKSEVDSSENRTFLYFHLVSKYTLQLLSKIFIDSDFCHNYLHTLYLFECVL